jgi:hypothetical protein
MVDRADSRELRRPPRERSNVVHVHHHRSGGVAAVLELIFGLFLGTFGIGHIYSGNVGSGLVIMFGWWFFIGAKIALSFLTCGIWYFAAIVAIPALVSRARTQPGWR